MNKGERIDKPWGHELIWARTDQYVGKKLVIEPGNKLSLQYHEEKIETILVNRGTLHLHVGDTEEEVEVREVEEGSFFHIPPGRIHRFEAREPVELIEVSTTELDDVVRLQDDYGRES